MMRMITSAHNPRVKDAVKLRDARQRRKQGRIVIDGAREILLALAGGVRMIEAFVCPELANSNDAMRAIGQLETSDAQIWRVPPEVFARLAFGQRAEGIVAVAHSPSRQLAQLHLAADAVVAVLEGVEKPGNLGAVLRTADAAGISAVISADSRCDLFNPNCIRASLGTVFTSQVCQAAAGDARAWLLQHGYRILAARPDAELDYTRADYCGPVAIVLGSEALGLSDVWKGDGTCPIKLPMLGRADSLNVSTTAAVLFYEALRQRRSISI